MSAPSARFSKYDPPLTCDGKADPLESGIFCWMANQKNYGFVKLF